jgi:hypothetical protein
MKQTAKEAKENSCCVDSDPPEYPYGLSLSLNEDTLAKLGITAPPAVGTTMMITARVVVTSASQYQSMKGDPELSSSWQITDLECSSTQSDSQSSAASALYPGT